MIKQLVALILKDTVYVHDINSLTIQNVLTKRPSQHFFQSCQRQSQRFLYITKPQYTFTILATIHHLS